MWTDRRQFLQSSGLGFGGLALSYLLQGAPTNNPLAAKAPPLPATAKSVIFLFMHGGPSHIDTFDPKPALEKYAGKNLPMPNLATERKTGAAFPSPFKFQKYGESGIEVSELFQHTAQHIDDMAVIRSMHADVPNHEPKALSVSMPK